jgi:hypothetical protein
LKPVSSFLIAQHLQEHQLTKTAGIITFHNAENYGAALQTYALMSTLQNLGCDCEVVDYRNPGVLKRNLIKNLYYALTVQHPFKNQRAYRDFRKQHFHLSQRSYHTLSDFEADAGKYDYLFFGSDQIWNPDLSNGFDPLYFGQFSTPARKIAYAASVGKDHLAPDERQTINRLIKSFDAVAVREETLLPLLEGDVACVVDPCMLLPAEKWNQIAGEIRLNEGYILVYQLFPNKDILQAALHFAHTLKKKVALISPYLNFQGRGQVVKLGRISPNDFLAYYRHADLVFSDSFHGTLFSILYQKPFYTLLPSEKTGRITSLLEKLNLSDRIIEKPVDTIHPVDYSRVEPLVQVEVQRSLDYIRRNLL